MFLRSGIDLVFLLPGLVLVLVATYAASLPMLPRWALLILGGLLVVGATSCSAAHARKRLAPNCVPCRREPPYRNCVPSICVNYPGGLLCCLGGKRNLPERPVQPLAPTRKRDRK